MSFTETTLVVRGDIDSTAANCLATSVANAATDGKLLVQNDGAVVAGDASGAQNGLIKLTAAHAQPDGSLATLSSTEFLRSDIKNIKFSQPNAGTNQVITVGNIVASMNSIRLEAKNGVELYDVLGVTGKNAAEIVANFAGRSDTERFKNVTMAVSGSNVAITVTPRGSDVVVTGDDALTVSVSGDNNGRLGQQSNVIDLETRAYISAGAYNQYEFPIVVPASATSTGLDYSIYTIEIEKSLPNRRKINEVVRICIADDEGDSNLLEALEEILGSSIVDVTAPAAFTAAFDAASYSTGDDDEFTFTFASAEVGTTYSGTITGGTSNVTNSFTGVVAAADETISTAITAGDYTEAETVTITMTLTDGTGNVTTVTANDTATIAA